MMKKIVTYENVKRKVFDEVADLCTRLRLVKKGDYVSVEYNCGQMRVKVKSNETKFCKEVLQKISEILAKY